MGLVMVVIAVVLHFKKNFGFFIIIMNEIWNILA